MLNNTFNKVHLSYILLKFVSIKISKFYNIDNLNFMKHIYAVFGLFLCFLNASATLTTNFSIDNVIQDRDKTISLHSLEILENVTIVTIKIIPKINLNRLNFWSSENTVIKAGESELPIIGFQITSKENGEKMFSTEPFNGKWGWNDLKKGKNYYYTMAFEGKIPKGVFKISLIDYGTVEGFHGYIFRNQIINNEPLREYDFKPHPLKSYLFENQTVQSNDKSHSASLISIKIFSNYTTVTIRLIPNQNLETLLLFQSENTNLNAGIYRLPIQGFLGDFNEGSDSTLISLPFNGGWRWSNVKSGKEYYYTMVFDGKIPYGEETISILDNGNDAGIRGFSFDAITIVNPVPFDWANLDGYIIYQCNHIIKYILSQKSFVRIVYISLIAIICFILLYSIIRLLTRLLANILCNIQNKTQQTKLKKININDVLKETDKTIIIKVIQASGDTAEYKAIKLRRKIRVINGRYVQYFTTGDCFSRVYLHPGEYLYKVVLSFIEIKERCKSSSIKKAFSECPSLLQQLNSFVRGENSDWIFVKWLDGQETICLRNMFIFNEVGAYKRGQYSLNRIIEEVPKIQTSLLKEKFSFAKFLRKNSKWIIRGGVKLLAATVAGYIGANLPDFDFEVDVEVPDIEPDFDFNADVDMPNLDSDYDINSSLDSENLADGNNSQNGYNVSFGASDTSLERDLRQAQTDIDYYERKIRNFTDDTTNTYKRNCLANLTSAVKKANEITSKLKGQ